MCSRYDGTSETQLALAELSLIQQDIDLTLPRLAKMSAVIQRFMIHRWSCRAHACCREGYSLPISKAVKQVIEKLSSICRTNWPGVVQSLRRTAQPFVMDWTFRSSIPVSTWREAAEATTRNLERLRARNQAQGFDFEGWSDPPQDPPTDPAELLDQVEASIVKATGELDSTSDLVRYENVGILISAALKLRWLRHYTDQPLVWGKLIGRLRYLRDQYNKQASTSETEFFSEILKPTFQPLIQWSQLAADQDEENRIASLMRLAPTSQSAPADLNAWLIQAFDVMDTPSLSDLLGPVKAQVAEIDPITFGGSDRRLRRRLGDLQRSLFKELKPVYIAEPKKEADIPSATAETEELLRGVLPHTKGKRILFIGNRTDNELKDRLETLLEATIEWCDCNQNNRLVNRCEAIENGTYDLVMSAAGLSAHRTDILLVQATNGRVPLVRVGRGRPSACLRALASKLNNRIPT